MVEPMSTEREARIRALGDDEFRDVLVMDNAVDDLLAEIDRLRAIAPTATPVERRALAAMATAVRLGHVDEAARHRLDAKAARAAAFRMEADRLDTEIALSRETYSPTEPTA